MTQVARPITDASGRIVKPAEKQGQIEEWLNANRRGIRLPQTIDLDRLKFATYMCFRKNPAILECDQDSILNAVLQIAMYGLYPGPLAHLVPFKSECTPILDYKGLVDLVVQAGAKKVEAHVVREGDTFTYEYGLNPTLVHKPAGSAGRVTNAYAIVWLPDGTQQFEVMDRAELDAIKNNSAAVRSGRPTPWKTHESEMQRKTVVRKLAKFLRKGAEALSRVIDFEERMDAGLKPSYDVDVREIERTAASLPEGYEPPPLEQDAVCPVHGEAVCPVHGEAFFQKGQMKSPAHKYKGEDGKDAWCNWKPAIHKDELAAAAAAISWTADHVTEYCKEAYSKTWSQLSMSQVQAVLAELRGMAEMVGNEDAPETEPAEEPGDTPAEGQLRWK